jgi:hypothetical protein
MPADGNRAELVFKELKKLKENLEKLPEGSENDWIETKVPSSIGEIEVFIFLHEEAFNYDLDTFFAQYIAVKQQFGNISIYPIQTILVHEINMSGLGFATTDTHFRCKRW